MKITKVSTLPNFHLQILRKIPFVFKKKKKNFPLPLKYLNKFHRRKKPKYGATKQATRLSSNKKNK